MRETIAGIDVFTAVGDETLVPVPGRELVRQWCEELRSTTDLDTDQIGECHGGTREIRPVITTTHQIAGTSRRRSLFDPRRWGLIIYGEAHHIPSRIFQQSTDLQPKHHLGLSVTPIHEDDRKTEIFTLIGPSIDTD